MMIRKRCGMTIGQYSGSRSSALTIVQVHGKEVEPHPKNVSVGKLLHLFRSGWFLWASFFLS